MTAAAATKQQEEKDMGNSPEKATNMDGDDDDAKCHSFRKRRLSYARHNLEGASDAVVAAAASALSSKESPSTKKARTAQEDSTILKSRILHAGELMRRFSSPAAAPDHRLYQGPFAPAEKVDNKTPWKKRHTRQHHEDDTILPFPRHVVGTYSCHGMEPVLDSDYEHEEDEEEDDDDWVPPGTTPKQKEKKQEEAPAKKEEESSTEKLSAKINQDRACVAFPYGNCPRTALFAAFDGHGQGGELVSQFTLHELPKRLEQHPDFDSDIDKAFKDVFQSVDFSLTQEPLIEPLYAGTTACVALLRDNLLSIANAGDSRAVLGCLKGNNKHNALDLTQDQNPDLPQEQDRIEKAGGFVSAAPEKGLSARVWLDCAFSMIGLAMSRSIGDHAVKTVGVISEPVVTTHKVTEEDDFMIVATDGVWEFLSSQDAVDIVSECLEKEGSTKACQKLIEAAAAKWHEEEGDYRDDITAVVVRLQELWKSVPETRHQEKGEIL